MLMIGSNAGMIGMAKEHLGLSLALHVPVFVVLTKIDMYVALRSEGRLPTQKVGGGHVDLAWFAESNHEPRVHPMRA